MPAVFGFGDADASVAEYTFVPVPVAEDCVAACVGVVRASCVGGWVVMVVLETIDVAGVGNDVDRFDVPVLQPATLTTNATTRTTCACRRWAGRCSRLTS